MEESHLLASVIIHTDWLTFNPYLCQLIHCLLHTLYTELEKEKKLQNAMLGLKKKFGKNAVLKGTNYLDGATMRERNQQIGGHKAK